MIDISKNPSVILEEGTNIVCYEYIIGYRFTIHVDNGDIFLSQDEEFNRNLFGDVLDLTDTWERVTSNYRVTTENLNSLILKKYDIECVLFNGNNMQKLGMDPLYSGIGLIAVAVLVNGVAISAKKFIELCLSCNIPYLKFSFCGTTDLFAYKANEYITQSDLSRERTGYGAVILNDPPVSDENGNTKRFLIRKGEAQAKRTTDILYDAPEVLSREFVRSTINPEKLIELEKLTGISPVLNKVKFRNIILNYLKGDMSADYSNYLMRSCIKDTKDFDSLLKSNIKEYVEFLTSSMDRYRLL